MWCVMAIVFCVTVQAFSMTLEQFFRTLLSLVIWYLAASQYSLWSALRLTVFNSFGVASMLIDSWTESSGILASNNRELQEIQRLQLDQHLARENFEREDVLRDVAIVINFLPPCIHPPIQFFSYHVINAWYNLRHKLTLALCCCCVVVCGIYSTYQRRLCSLYTFKRGLNSKMLSYFAKLTFYNQCWVSYFYKVIS